MPHRMRDQEREQSGRPTADARARDDLMQFWTTLQRGAPQVNRRDLVRWSALTAGAVATARIGVQQATASRGSVVATRAVYQEEEIVRDATISVPFNPYGQPVILDPHRAPNWGPFWVMFPNVWGGLVRYTETGQVDLDLAESYTVSDDGLIYTFKIRPDARYANGNQVIAEHFIQSWQRALDSSDPAPMAFFMQHVEGFQEYLDGDSEEIGFRAVDDATVEVTLSDPFNYFLSYMAAFVWDVIDPEVLEAEGEEDFVFADAGTGPWRFTEFETGVQFVMEPNPHHYGGNSPSIAQIVWPIVTGPQADSTALNLYRDDEAVSADVPLSLLASVEQDPELSRELVRIEPQGSTRSLAMDFNQEPFDDVRVRRAFAMAIDQEQWANEIWEGTFVPTTSFTPPVVATISNYEPPDGIGFNPDQARDLLEEAGYPNGDGLPEITYYQSAEDSPEEIERAAALLQMLNDNLGVEIIHDTTRTTEQILALQEDEGGRQFDIIWWWNVTETPYLLSEVFRTDSPYMEGVFNWNVDLEATDDFDPGADAQEFDELMAQADLEQDPAQRNELYRQGEELVLRNAVYVPLGHWVQQFVQKPWLQGTKQGPWTGRLPVWFDRDVVVLEHEEVDEA